MAIHLMKRKILWIKDNSNNNKRVESKRKIITQTVIATIINKIVRNKMMKEINNNSKHGEIKKKMLYSSLIYKNMQY